MKYLYIELDHRVLGKRSITESETVRSGKNVKVNELYYHYFFSFILCIEGGQ